MLEMFFKKQNCFCFRFTFFLLSKKSKTKDVNLFNLKKNIFSILEMKNVELTIKNINNSFVIFFHF